MSLSPTVRLYCAAALAYLCLAAFLTWPLPLHLGTHLTGMPDGDTGSYVWNLWVFRHELESGRLPFYTSSILTFGNQAPIDLSLHNYTTFANLLAAPLLPSLGVVATFNLIYILNVALSGLGMFALRRDKGAPAAESWIAGLLFAACPFLIARGTAHFSLVAAAPLPLFLLFFSRTLEHHRLRDATIAGLMVAWAEFCDVYYAVYCLMIAIFSIGAHWLRVRLMSRQNTARPRMRLVRLLDVAMLLIGGFVFALALRSGGPVQLFGFRISMRTMYTPMLILTTLAVIRLIVALRPVLVIHNNPFTARLWQAAAVGILATAVPLSPVLYAFGERLAAGQAQMPPTYWRSSPPGADLLAFVLPNPNHPLWGAPFHDLVLEWSGRSDGFQEFTVSIPLIAIGVILLAWRYGWRPAPVATTFTAVFGLLALGPFVQIAGFNTHIPGPWALLRYVPVISLARSPSRFAIVAMLGITAMFCYALTYLTKVFPQRRRMILTTVAALLLVELCPAPRPLYSAEIPSIYRIIAADPDDKVRVLELPFGVRDGASSLGDFSAFTQYCQTAHGKRLVGGALSRVSQQRKHLYQRVPTLDALMTLSEGRPLLRAQELRAEASVDRFLGRAHLGYVVIHRANTSPALRDFAMRLFQLRKIAEDGDVELYVPTEPKSTAKLFNSPPSFLDSIVREHEAARAELRELRNDQ